MSNRAEISRRALRRLGVIDESETPTASEQLMAEEYFDAVLAELSIEGLVDGVSASVVPDWAAVPMELMIAYECAPSFGREPAPFFRAEGLRRLRKAQSFGGFEDLNAPIYQSGVV